MEKYGRNYLLQVETKSGNLLQIKPPFSVEFDIVRSTLTSANLCQLRIYNLSELNRNQIRKDAKDFGSFRTVSFQAGYGSSLSLAFTGNISAAWSVREGVNFVTQIECYDGGFAFVNGKTNMVFPAGTPQAVVIGTLAATLPGVSVGAIGAYGGVLARGNCYSGNTCNILQEITGGGFFIDNGKANALGDNEFIAGINDVTLINSASGLLGTPALEQYMVRFDMIFEPRLDVGQAILLDSSTGAGFNGLYKVTAVKHRGIISEAVCGAAITTGEFNYGTPLVPIVGR